MTTRDVRLDKLVKKPSNFDVEAFGNAICRRFNSLARNDLIKSLLTFAKALKMMGIVFLALKIGILRAKKSFDCKKRSGMNDSG